MKKQVMGILVAAVMMILACPVTGFAAERSSVSAADGTVLEEQITGTDITEGITVQYVVADSSSESGVRYKGISGIVRE